MFQRREEKQCGRLTSKVEDLGPLLADVDSDVGSTHGQVGTTLVEHQGLHLRGEREKCVDHRVTWQ